MRTLLWDTKLATTRAVNSIRSWPECIGCYSKECSSECSRTSYKRLHTTMLFCRQAYHPDGCMARSVMALASSRYRPLRRTLERQPQTVSLGQSPRDPFTHCDACLCVDSCLPTITDG